MEGCEAKISTEVTTSATGVTVQEVGPNGNLMPKFNTPVEVSVSYDPEGVSINVSRGGASPGRTARARLLTAQFSLLPTNLD